ncbi:LacI family DNA-binding transcriptional regulator [Devosia sp. ZW T5_3]|uniref:LacI family DNA-binding transcriptional regulator n=1 Tax=Devosia sp. ZW T5_3 TaxID=3378085 RepID=UPI00385374B0
MNEFKKTPTIQDVARVAEVSSATVSRALTSPERVSEATRERITAAVVETGYTVNQMARSLRLRAAKTILIAIPNIGNPFYSTILDAVVQDAAERGYGVLVANRLGGDPTLGLKDYFYSNRADGLLLFDATLNLEALQDLPLVRGNRPLVLSCDDIPDAPLDLVMTDNRDAADTATRHLIELGHKRIGTVRSRTTPNVVSERHSGFERALKRANLPIRQDWIWQGDHTIGGGIGAAESWLALNERPTAMFCGNDETAIGFISRLRQAGIDCPRDVSVVGFDDIAVAQHLSPALTTMRQPRYHMGKVATALLLDILEGPTAERTPTRRILKSELIIRASTASPRDFN